MPHPSLQQLDHRPWPIPGTTWRMKQEWHNLLFAHWPVPKSTLEPLVPDPLQVQEFEGNSWIGVVPFQMEGVTFRPFPVLPRISSFLELNLRLYVEYNGKPGVWFLSLDASSRVAVWVARKLFALPYYNAEMKIQENTDTFKYRSKRKHRSAEPLRFETEYKPTSNSYSADQGTLEHWLTERYCLYAMDGDGDLYRTEIHHAPWSLQRAEGDILINEVADPYEIDLQGVPSMLHFSSKIEVVAWMPEKIG
ncbi:MAG: DUF2071 domain-containing protein [Balneolaceae bacterium]|nr:DUF2071 domain-containing protein [Balneolaceae bacterium]